MIKFLSNYKHHFIFWTLIYLYTLYSIYEQVSNLAYTLQLATELIIFMTSISYMHFYFLNKYLIDKKLLYYIPGALVVIAVFSMLFHFYFTNFYNYTNSLIQTVASILFILFITTALKIFRHFYSQKIKYQEIYSKQLETELELLKSQINPHFMFNTLNSIYSLSIDKSDILPDTIIKLSDLMRYLTDSRQKQKVDLEKELEFIQNYISLERLRLQDDFRIEFDITGSTDNKEIAPMVLIPLVENCFKHGLDIINKKGFIKIAVSVSGKYLEFYSENSKPEKRKPVSGFGIENLKQRLRLIYDENFSLDFSENETAFCVSLKVIL